MPFDGVVLSALKKELILELVDGKVERIYQPNQFEVNLYVYKLGKNKKNSLSPQIPLCQGYTSQKGKRKTQKLLQIFA